MKAEVIIDHETQEVKLVFDCQGVKIGKHLSADEAENVMRLIEEATPRVIARKYS